MRSDRADFIRRYGGIYEHSPWVAEETFEAARQVSSPAELADLFAACVDRAPHARKLALIRAHPDLAGRAAVAGELSDDSTEEQARAGIGQCTKEEFERFRSLNEAYKERFGFPFIMAVRNSDRQEILAAFEERIGHDAQTEFDRAMLEIHKIAKLRLESL